MSERGTRIHPQAHRFLEDASPARNGFIATSDEDGSPRVVPVWYLWDRERVHVWSDETRIWVRNLRRDPRVGFSVAEDGPPFRAVVIKGRADLRSGDAAMIRRIVAFYMAPDAVDTYLDSFPGPGIMVRITPARTLYRSD